MRMLHAISSAGQAQEFHFIIAVKDIVPVALIYVCARGRSTLSQFVILVLQKKIYSSLFIKSQQPVTNKAGTKEVFLFLWRTQIFTALYKPKFIRRKHCGA